MAEAPGHSSRRCVVQLYSRDALTRETNVAAHAARLSLSLAQNFSRRHGYRHLAYDCATRVHCMKPPSLADACWVHGCSELLYLDSDVFVTNPEIDPVEDILANFPRTVVALGLDYYRTIRNPAWHDAGPHVVHPHAVHLPLGALLSPCTMWGTGTTARSACT